MAINTLFQNIADAIRARGGTSAAITPAGMPQAIMDIPGGGGDDGHIMHFDFTKSSVDEISGVTAQLTGCSITTAGLSFNAASQNCQIPFSYFPRFKISVEFGDIEFQGSSAAHCSLLMVGDPSAVNGLLRRSNGMLAWYFSAWTEIEALSSINNLSDKTLSIEVKSTEIKLYIDDVLKSTVGFSNEPRLLSASWNIGNTRTQSNGGQFYNAIVKTVDVYYISDT